ncbi:MAG: hypothetical protein IKE30_00905 [Clostridia bacterium]|nr:hypothetical protein [Clostridia bacterium]
MQERLFRKKSIERISSPEQLNDYMQVTNPGIWMVLAAVIILLAGLIVSSALATLQSTIPAQGEVLTDGRSISVELPISRKDAISPGMPVKAAGLSAHVEYIYQNNDVLNVIVLPDDGDASLPAGIYDVEIIEETIAPISFLLN